MPWKDKEKRKQYDKKRSTTPEFKEYHKQYFLKNKEYLKKQKKKYANEHREQTINAQRKYRKEHREEVTIYNKKYSLKNIERLRDYQQKYNKLHQEKRKIYQKVYRQDHKKELREKANKYCNEKMLNNPKFNLNRIMKSRVRSLLKAKNLSKSGKRWIDLVDFTLEELKFHLEKQFEPWMNWNNLGYSTIPNIKWSIDHIVALKHFNFTSTDDEEFKLAWDLSNLQPLDSYINIFVKKSRLDYYIEFPIQKLQE